MFQIPVPLLMALTVFGGNQGREGQVFKQAFPAMLSGPGGFVLAVHAARKQLKQQDEENKKIIQEVVDADRLLDSTALKTKSKTLGELYDKLPAGSIKFSTPPS
jgi:hypothetical protein